MAEYPLTVFTELPLSLSAPAALASFDEDEGEEGGWAAAPNWAEVRRRSVALVVFRLTSSLFWLFVSTLRCVIRLSYSVDPAAKNASL